MIRNHKLEFLLLSFLFIIQTILWFHTPLNGIDGPASWSHAYSILNYQFNFDNYFFSQPRYSTGILAWPFFGIFKSFYAPYFYMLIWQIASIVLLHKVCSVLNKKAIYWTIILLLFASPLLWTQRQEIVALPFVLFFIYTVFQNNKTTEYKIIVSSILLIICFSIHPLSGITAFVLFYGLKQNILLPPRKKWVIIALLITLPLVLVSIFLHSLLPYLLMHFWERITDYNLLYTLKALVYFATLIILFILKLKGKRKYIFILYVLMLFLLNMTHYWIYIPLFLFFVNEVYTKYWTRIACSFLIFFSVINPIIQHSENDTYGRTSTKVLRSVATIKPTGKIFIESRIAIPQIYSEQARLISRHRNSYSLHDEIKKDDIIILTSTPNKYQLEFLNNNKGIIKEIIPSSPGLLTLQSFYSKRSTDIGLWIVEFP